MEYIQEITLDLNTHSAPVIVNAKQGDTNSRILLIHYTKNGVEYKISEYSSVALRVRKPDMHLIFNDGVINDDGTVSITLTYQCLAISGRAYADLVEFNQSGQMLSTVSFIIDIQAMPDVMGDEAISSNEFLYLKSFVDRGNDVIGKAQEWANGYNGETPVSSDNPAYNNHSKYWASQAESKGEEKVQEAAIKVQDAEAWATGTRNEEPISSDDPAYNNNSKYWAYRTKACINTIRMNYNPVTGILSMTIDDL